MAVDLKKLDRLYNNTQTVPQAKKSVQGGIDMDRLTALYNNAPEPKVRQEQNFSAPVFEVKEAETKQPVNNAQRRNYEQMQGLFNRSKKSDEEELNRINTEISAISGYGVGADRSRLQQLFREKDAVEQRLKVGRYDEDLTALERVQLSAQGIGEGYDVAAGVLADTAVQAVKDTAKNIRNDEYKTLRKQQLDTDNQIALLERRAGQGVLDAAGFAQLAELRKQKEKQAENVLQYRTPLDMDADSMQAMKRAMQAQQQATYGMGEGAATAYSVGVSIADSASRMPLMLIPVIGPALSAGVTSARIAAEKAYDVGSQGKTAAEALTRGAVSGGIEYFAEKYGLDELGKLVKSGAGRTYLKTFFKDAAENLPSALKSAGKFAGNMHRQGKAEASEEFVSYVLNFVADAMANDPNAKFSLEEAAVATLGGYVSGGVFGAGGQIADYAVNRNVQQDVTDTDVGNKIAEDTDVPGKNTENAVINAGFENETAKNAVKNGESVIISEKIDSTGAINAAKTAEREALEKQVQEIAGIDTRSEAEKVEESEQSKVDMLEKLAAEGIAPQEDVERQRQSSAEKIADARAKESLDSAVKLIEYVGKEADVYSDSRDRAAAYNTAKRIGINLAREGTTAMGRAVHEVGHDKTATKEWNRYTAALDKVISTDGRLVKLMEDIDYAYRNSEDADIRASVTFEDGSFDEEKLRNEQYLKLTEIMLPNIAKGDKQLLDAIKKDRSVIDNLLDFIRGIKNKVSIKLTKSEAAMLDEAERQLVNLLRDKGVGRDTSYSAEIDNNNAGNYNEVKGGVENEILSDEKWSGRRENGSRERLEENTGELSETGRNSNSRGNGQDRSGDSSLYDNKGNRIPKRVAEKLNGTAVLDNGKPILLYHFTPNMDFDVFGRGDTGFHFGEYSHAIGKKHNDELKKGESLEGRVLKVYLNIKNPIRVNDADGFYPLALATQLYGNGILSQTEFSAILQAHTNGKGLKETDIYNSVPAQMLRFMLNEKGIDGFVYGNIKEGKTGSSYMALYPEQIIIVDDGRKTGTSEDVSFSLHEEEKSYSLDDIDEREYWGENSKSRAVERHAVNEFINLVADLFGVEHNDKTEILKKQAWKLADAAKKTGTFNVQQMLDFFNNAYSIGKQEVGNLDERNKQLKKELRNLGIKPLKGREYLDFVQKYKGKILFNRNGLEIDEVYMQLCEEYPEFFSEFIKNPYDQMRRIGEVYDSIQGKKISNAEFFGDDAEAFKSAAMQQYTAFVDNFIDTMNSVSRYQLALAEQSRQQQEDEKKVYTLEDVENARKLAQPLLKEIARIERKALLTVEDRSRLNEMLKLSYQEDVNRMQDYLRSTNPMADDIIELYEKKRLLAEIQKPIFAYNTQRKARMKARFLDMLTSADGWADKKSGLAYMNNTFERNIDDVVTDKKAAEAIKDALPRQIHKHVAEATRYKNKLRNKIRSFDIDTKKEYDVAFKVNGEYTSGKATEADLIQLYGEKLVGKSYLKKIGADVDKIERLTGEFREIYNELFEKINEAYVSNGYAPMEYRQDYFPHFFDETGDTLLNKVGAFLGFDTKNMLPTEIAGRTHEFSPGRQWNSHALQRKGENTEYNVLKGFDNYIEAAANIIHLTEDIQNLRAFENAIRYKYSDEGMRAELDAIDALNISETEKEKKRKEIFGVEDRNTRLNNFVVWEHEYTNILAGKKSKADRWIEDMFGRRFYTLAKNIENRVSANMIAGNISSALTNFIPITQLTAEVDGRYIMTAMSDTMKNLKNSDGFADMSDFLTNRFGSEMLSLTQMQKAANIAGKPMELVDEFTSNVVTRARYLQNVDKNGMDSAAAMAEADEYAARLMADRSKGALPVIFESRNPIIKLFTMFQVEQNNQLQYFVKDLPKKMQGDAKKWIIWGLIKASVFAALYNALFRKLAGREPALSPIDFVVGTGKDVVQVAKGEMKASAAMSNAFVDVMENLPYMSSVLAVTGLSEDAGRIPVSGALPDFSQLFKIFDRDVSADKKMAVAKKELAKPAFYLAAPFAGGAAKKVADTAELYGKNKGAQYSIQNDGSRKLQFANDPSVGAVAQSAVFGKWASEPAQEYINSGFKGLTKGQTENFELYKSWGMSNSEAFAKAKGTTAMSDKQADVMTQLTKAGVPEQDAYTLATTYRKEADTDGNGSVKTAEAKAYIDKLDMTREQKALLFSCMCPTVKKNPYK